MPPRADTLKELRASKMADEALAGLDEGALRKLVSSPMTVLWGGKSQARAIGPQLLRFSAHTNRVGLEERLRKQRQVGSI